MEDTKYLVADIPPGVMSLVAGVLGVDASELKPFTEDSTEIGNTEIGDEVNQFADEKTKKKLFFHYPLGMPIKAMKMPKEVLEDLYREIPELRKVTSPDWIYNAYLIKNLQEDGKVAVIMANASTWNNLNTGVREFFVRKGLVDTVIALPPRLFNYTNIEADLVVFDRGNSAVRLIDATEICDRGRRQAELSPENIDEILGLLELDNERSVSVTAEELGQRDYILNPFKYLKTVPAPENGVTLGSVASVIRGAQLGAKDLDQIVTEEDTGIRYLMLSDIQNGLISGDLKFIKEPDPKYHKFYIWDKNLLISKSGIPLRVAIAEIKEGEKILATGNLFILKVDEKKINPYYLRAYFDSEAGMAQLQNIAVGAILPNISAESLKNLVIPIAPMAKQAEIAERYREKLAQIKGLQAELRQAYNALKDIYE